VGVLPIDTDGLDECQVLVCGFATVLDRPLHEHVVILQHYRSQTVDHFAPTSGRSDAIRRTVRAGQELVAVRQAPTRAKLRSQLRQRLPQLHL
jgi:hypothetical protein